MTHTGEDGDPRTAIDLSRIAPGGNALIEGLGQGGFTLSALTAPFQPIIGATLEAAAGEEMGRPSQRSKLEILARQIVGLPPPLRPLSRGIGKQSDYSKLFEKITGKKGDFKQYALPDLKLDLATERKVAHVSRLMDKAFGEANDSDAREELEGLLDEYGIRSEGSSGSSSKGWRSGGSSSTSIKGWR